MSITTEKLHHFKCDCVPGLGPAHCHRCSQIIGTEEAPVTVIWEEALCKTLIEASGLDQPGSNIHTKDVQSLIGVAVNLINMSMAHPDIEAIFAREYANLSKAEEPTAAAATPAKPLPAPPKTKLIRPEDRPPSKTSVAYSTSGAPRELELINWRATYKASTQAEAFGLSHFDLTELILDASITNEALHGAVNYFSGKYCLLANPNEGVIISIVDTSEEGLSFINNIAERATKDRPLVYSSNYKGHSKTSTKPKSGGAGKRMPSNVKELSQMLLDHGFTETGTNASHLKFRHDAHPEYQLVLARTTSDHRSYANAIADVKRMTGIDLRVSP